MHLEKGAAEHAPHKNHAALGQRISAVQFPIRKRLVVHGPLPVGPGDSGGKLSTRQESRWVSEWVGGAHGGTRRL